MVDRRNLQKIINNPIKCSRWKMAKIYAILMKVQPQGKVVVEIVTIALCFD